MNSADNRIRNIFCPTDLSPKSQTALSVAAGLASHLSAKLTACHCVSSNWFTTSHDLPEEDRRNIELQVRAAVVSRFNGSSPEWKASIVENSNDPGRDILRTASESGADLIVLKARKGVRSALHYGSLVERITRGSSVPVLLLPSKYLERVDPLKIDFQQVLFDYDFSEATDRLFPFAMDLTKGYNANLHLLAILDPPKPTSAELAEPKSSRSKLQSAARQRLNDVLDAGSGNLPSADATVEWGERAETILDYAEKNHIDLICTTLSPAYFYYEKLYCAYLGQLLQSAKCPILALRSV